MTSVRYFEGFATQNIGLWQEVGDISMMKSLLALCLLLNWHVKDVFAKQPNILFVLTDDQDAHMDSVAHMPFLQVSPSFSQGYNIADEIKGRCCEQGDHIQQAFLYSSAVLPIKSNPVDRQSGT